MPQLGKLLIVFVVLVATLPSPIHPHKDDLSPEPQHAFDQEKHMAPEYQHPSSLANAPYIEKDYTDAENPSVSPLPLGISLDIQAPYAEDNEEDELYYDSPSEAPSPSPAGFMFSGESDTDTPYSDDDAVPPPQPHVLPFNYSAEDDTGEFTSENYYHEGYHVEKKNVAVAGFVIGAICLVGLGGYVCKRKNQKRKQYQHLFNKRGDI